MICLKFANNYTFKHPESTEIGDLHQVIWGASVPNNWSVSPSGLEIVIFNKLTSDTYRLESLSTLLLHRFYLGEVNKSGI